MELYVDETAAAPLIAIAGKYAIDARIVGRVEAAEKAMLTIRSEKGTFSY